MCMLFVSKVAILTQAQSKKKAKKSFSSVFTISLRGESLVLIRKLLNDWTRGRNGVHFCCEAKCLLNISHSPTNVANKWQISKIHLLINCFRCYLIFGPIFYPRVWKYLLCTVAALASDIAQIDRPFNGEKKREKKKPLK